jgi:1-acyl-sn-glycerol-3-phosphate acyltransferase
MKLYWLLIRFLRLVNLLYFVDIRSVGREQVPGQGPVIVAANHPSSILDSILLATQIHRPINYIARSGLFRFPVLATVFRWLGAVPIYRPTRSRITPNATWQSSTRCSNCLRREDVSVSFPKVRIHRPRRSGHCARERRAWRWEQKRATVIHWGW